MVGDVKGDLVFAQQGDCGTYAPHFGGVGDDVCGAEEEVGDGFSSGGLGGEGDGWVGQKIG